jgi:uroporphyrinogen III methyltransferase / synthase
MPNEYRAEAIVDAIGLERIRGKRFLIPRAEVARDALPTLLRKLGATEVAIAPAYRSIKPKGAQVERIRELIASRRIDLVTFTSSSTVTNFSALVGRASWGLKAAAIGPITAGTARRLGFKVVVKPAEYTIPALTDAIRRYCERARRGAPTGAS